MKNPILRAKVLSKCDYTKSKGRQFQEKNPILRTYQKMSPEMVYDLLENVTNNHNNAKIKAKQLLKHMSEYEWFISGTAHEGGLGDAQRKPDPVLHITLSVDRIGGCHLRCRVPKQHFETFHIYEITTKKPILEG